MTGYGFAHLETAQFVGKVEVKSLNSKNLDTNIRLPKGFFDKEIEVRNMIATVLERGKVTLSADFVNKESVRPKAWLNKPVLMAYVNQFRNLQEELGEIDVSEILKLAMKLPDSVINEVEDNAQETEWSFLRKAVQQALEKCNQFRSDEGNMTSQKMEGYIKKIKKLLQKVESYDPSRLDQVRQRLQEKIAQLLQSSEFDKNRFEEEMIYYLEKLDISEEKVRLESHLDYFLQTLNSESSNGKKLGFISQEIGREINTIGSKVNDATVQRLVVEMKDELEKIKEQCLNLL